MARMPMYKLKGSPVLYVAGCRRHYSLYPAGAAVVAAFKDKLAPYKIDKGAIRCPLSQPVSAKLIERIAKFRTKEITERELRPSSR